MAAITLADRTSSVKLVYPSSGAPTGLLSPNNYDNKVYNCNESYSPASTLSSGGVVALFYFNKPVRFIHGYVQGSGFATGTTVDIGWCTVASQVDTNIQDFAAAIPIATAGEYPALGGLASSTGKPANIGLTFNPTTLGVTGNIPFLIVARFNVANVPTTAKFTMDLLYTFNYL